MSAIALEQDANKDITAITDLTAHEDDASIDASFLNKQETAVTPIELSGTKVWNDLSDSFGF